MAKNCGNCGVDTVNDYETCIYCIDTKSGTPSRWTEGENYVPDSISLRAVQCIERRAKQNGKATVTLFGIPVERVLRPGYGFYISERCCVNPGGAENAAD